MSSALTAIIHDEIAERGPISFRRFMELALYHPEHGYYSSGRAQVGRKGDFFTNVNVGPLFGKLLARQFAEMWDRLGKLPDFSIVEQGAHEGHFAADTLNALREFDPACFAATCYRIVEPSSVLTARQQKLLAGLPVTWSANLSELPRFAGVHFSNELLDAFPAHLITWNGAEWLERHIRASGDSFAFIHQPIKSPALRDACGRIPLPLPVGYTTEINLAAGDWLAELAGRLDRGYVFAIDYGYLREEYYKPERVEGTLSAYAHHRREKDPLRSPGEVDLTAHVEFSSVMDAAATAGLKLTGFTDQHHLMVGLGVTYFSDTSNNPSDMRAFQTLMHPTLMGMAFKAVCFHKGIANDPPLAGFRYARPI